MLPTEEVAAIHRALTAARGDRARAAEQLGLETDELRAKIKESPELRTLWIDAADKSPPTTAEAYDREKSELELLEPVDLGDVSPRQVAIADALVNQEQKLQKFDWEGLGVRDPKTIRLMQQFEHSVGRGIIRMLDAMCGGMGYCFAQVSARFAHAAEQLENPAVQADKALYAYWHAIFMDYAKEMKGFNKEATAAAHTRLLIADRARKLQSATNRLRKPGWQRVGEVKADDDDGKQR